MAPQELNAIFALRYEVYCLERGFLDPADYPDGLERDGYDPNSLHFGLYTTADQLAGTVRLVRGGLSSLPLSAHCEITADARSRLASIGMVGEMSRLAVSRNFRRREGDGFYSLQVAPVRPQLPRGAITSGRERRGSPPFVLHLYREIYQACRRSGIRFLLAAMERPLARLIAGFGFEFERIGPEVDYYGPVAPFVLDLDLFEQRQAVRRPGLLSFFTETLEPELLPPVLVACAEGETCITPERLSRNPV